MIYIIFLSCLISFIELHAMLPVAPEQTQSQKKPIKVQCSDEKVLEVEPGVWQMSKTLTDMINDLGGDTAELTAIPLPQYSCSTINDLSTVLENFNTTQTLNIQSIKNNTLKDMITISDAFHFLDFSKNKDLAEQWDKKCDGIIYQRCKDMSWEELEQQIIPLYPIPLHRDLTQIIFCNPIINKFKFELMKKALTLYDRRKELPIKVLGSVGDVTFSPDNKMLATIIPINLPNVPNEIEVTISLFDDNNTIVTSSNNLNIRHFWINSANFSSDSKKFIIGHKNNISIYDIDDAKNINKNSAQILAIGNDDQEVYGKQISLSRDGKLMASYDGNDLRLWHFNDNGTIDEKKSKSLIILDTVTAIISPIKFNDDGTICIISKNTTNHTSTLHIFNPDEPSKNSQSKIDANLIKASFYEHDKKFAAIIYEDNSRFSRKTSIYLYDFNDIDGINTSRKLIHSASFADHIAPCIILNDTAMIAKISPYNSVPKLFLVDINNTADSIEIPIAKTELKYFMSPDNKKIVFNQYRGPYILYTLLTPEKDNTLNSIRKLDIKPILLLDRILRKTEDVSSLEQYEIPKQLIELLKKIGLESQKKVLPTKESKNGTASIVIPESQPVKPVQQPTSARIAAAYSWLKSGFAALTKSQNPTAINLLPTVQKTKQTTKAEQSQDNNKPEPEILESIFSGISSIASSIISTIGSFVSAILKLFTR